MPRSSGYLAALGVCLAASLPFEAGPVPLAIALGGVLLAVLLRSVRLAVIAVAVVVFIACAWSWSRSCWPSSADGERVRAEAVIDSLVTLRNGALEFDADVTLASGSARGRTLRTRIVWRAPPRPWPAAGERWQLLLQLRAPRVPASGARDAAREAFRDGIHARATVIASPLDLRLASASGGLLVARAAIERALHELVPERETAALFAGLAVGATGAISREQWQVFSATGTTHLVAISGMHVTLFAWLTAALARILWSRVARLQAHSTREAFAGVLGVAAAAGYALMAGFGVPTQRTLVMLACWWWAKLAGREQCGYEVLGLAMLAILVLDPLAPLSSGFWLSFVAMATLLSGDLSLAPKEKIRPADTPWRRSFAAVRDWWRETAQTQWRVTLALAPVTLAWFAAFSLAGLLANFIAIPVFSFVLVPCVLAASAVQGFVPQVAAWILWPARIAWQGLWPLLQAFAAQPLANVTVPDDPLLWWLATPAVFLWLFPVPWRWRVVATGCLLPWFWPLHASPATGTAEIELLPAGDGVAVLVRTQQHALLYETGEAYGTRGRRAETLIIPALRARGVDAVDLLVLGRANGNNVAGVATLLRRERVRMVRAGGAWRDPPPRVGACRNRESWQWDEVTFTLLAATDAPSASCVLRIDARGAPARATSMLFAERLDAVESRALAMHPAARDVTVILAPRRGSPAAVSDDFVAAAQPRQVLIAAARFDAARRARIAQRWRIAPQCVLATASGPIAFTLRAGGSLASAGPEVTGAARLWRPAVPVGYDSAVTGAETARCGN